MKLHLLILATLLLAACGAATSVTPAPALAPEQLSTSPSCAPTFALKELGTVLTAEDTGQDKTAPVADPSPILLPDGRVRLYFLAGAPGVKSAISEDGIHFTIEEGARVSQGSGPVGPPRVVAVPGGYRMFVTTDAGFKSLFSSDGLTFTWEDGIRLSVEAEAHQQVIKFTPLQLPDSTWRAYFSNSFEPGQPVSQHWIKSATSPDLLQWTLEDTVAAVGREPFPMSFSETCTVLFYAKDGPPMGLAYSSSSDGITFSNEQELNTSMDAGAAVLKMPNGTVLFYHDSTSQEKGHYITVAQLSY